MNLNLDGKLAIVTGGSRGIGKEISKSLASEGVTVCIIARKQNDIDATCEEINSLGGKVIGFSGDVTQFSKVEAIVRKIIETFGAVDFLINNAGGISKFGSFQECNQEDWLSAFQLNVMSCVNLTKACESALLASKQARIITISSIVGLQPGNFNPHYSIVKAATINLSKHLANIYASEGILCNAICVGPVHSDSWMKNVDNLAHKKGMTFDESFIELEKAEQSKIPLGRIGEPADVASMVVFLVSEKASWITGTCINIAGGKYSAIS
jgi:3-oxoacyl-[acyl-carrier protein] reductase